MSLHTIVELSIVPIGRGTSLSGHIAEAVGVLEQHGLSYSVGPMGTTIEGEWDAVFAAIKECQQTLLNACPRVYTVIKCDCKADGQARMQDKVDSVRAKL